MLERKNARGWDETFMEMAHVIARRSKDPNTQVGACIVGKDNRILSQGYNGTTRGWDDKDFPWGRDKSQFLQNKYLFVVHAERNAILNFRGSNRELEDGTLFVTHFPCNECAKEIAQVGISRVRVERLPDSWTETYLAAIRILSYSGAEIYDTLGTKYDEQFITENGL